MDRLAHKTRNLNLRKLRIRKVVHGSAVRPRLTVYISNRHIHAQLIDDEARNTLAHVTTVGQKSVGSTMAEKATWVGNEIAKQAKAAKIKRIVFDRNGRLYHGRMRALAEAARKAGLEF